MEKKMLVSDLDGTLLKNDKTVSQETIDTLLEFKRNGNEILFATARAPRDAYRLIPKELIDNPVICYNGACISKQNKEIIYKKQLSKENIIKILQIVKEFGYDKIGFEINDEFFVNFDPTDFFGVTPNTPMDLDKFEFTSAYKILVCSKTPLEMKLKEKLDEFSKAIITDNGSLCQIMNKEVSKWSCIESIMKQKNISSKNIMAFGDDHNDYEMIKNAGVGVAMGNAEDRIKKIADFVTDTNMNNGVANFVKNYEKFYEAELLEI